MSALRIESWAELRDTIELVVPTRLVRVENGVLRSRISMRIEREDRRAAIAALRQAATELEEMAAA